MGIKYYPDRLNIVVDSVSTVESSVSTIQSSISTIQSSLSYKEPAIQTVVDKSANFTIQASDAGKLFRGVPISGAAAPFTVTIPDVLQDGQKIDFLQTSNGQITFAGSGITINSTDAKLKTAKAYAAATVYKAGGSYYLIGNFGIMSRLPFGILSSSAGGLSVIANNAATLTSDADYYYLTYTNPNLVGTLKIDGGPVQISYLLVAGGGGTQGIPNVGAAYTQWDCYYHYMSCDWWGNCWYDGYWCDSSKNVSVYTSASGGAGGVHAGTTTVNPGEYTFIVGRAGRGAPDGVNPPERGQSTIALGATVIGGGAGIVTGDTALRSGGSGASGNGNASSGTSIAGSLVYGNIGANGSIAGTTGSANIRKFGPISCWSAVSNGYYNNYNSYVCYQSQGTGGGPLSSGVGWGDTQYAFTDAPLGSWTHLYAPTSLSGGITSLGLTVGIAGGSPDIVTVENIAAYPGSGAGTSQNSNQRATDGVIRIRIAKSTMADVKVAA